MIEQLTGLKFSPHIGNVDSKIEEFNYWLNRENYLFDYKQTDNRDSATCWIVKSYSANKSLNILAN